MGADDGRPGAESRVRRLMACARETVTQPARAASRCEPFLDQYARLSDEEKEVLFRRLDEELEVTKREVVPAFEQLAAAARGDAAVWTRAVREVRRSLSSPRKSFLAALASRPGGMDIVLAMREDVQRACSRHNLRLDGLAADILELIEAWFRPDLLRLREIDHHSPFRTIKFLQEHELVHPALRLEDMGRRVGGRRRCFALSHCTSPDDPIVFAEVALHHRTARAIDEILDEGDGHAEARRPSTAVFYSINNTRPGLAGIGLGSTLIYRIMSALRNSVAGLETFVTLSPVPSFWRRFLHPLLTGDGCGLSATQEMVIARFGGEVLERLALHTGAPPRACRDAPAALLLRVLSTPSWTDDARLCDLVRVPLCDLVYSYLSVEHDALGRPLDPVAAFHLGNGASVRRTDINFAANRSPRGIAESCTVMVNYLYSAAWHRRIGRQLGSLFRWPRLEPASATRR